MNMNKNPNTNHLQHEDSTVFEMSDTLESLHNNLKIEREINEFAVETKYDLISLLDVSTRQLTMYKKGIDFEQNFLQSFNDFNTVAHSVLNNIVHVDDRDIFMKQLFDNLIQELDNKDKLVLEYRLYDAETKMYRWKKITYQYFKSSKNIIIQLREDIHDEKVIQTELEARNQKLVLSEKCFRVLSEHTNKVIFEWDFETNKIVAMSSFNALFGREAQTINSPDDALSVKAVHEEDRHVFTNVFDTILQGNPVDDARFRIKDSEGIFHWCSLSGVVVKDDEGKPFKAIGMLESIAKQLDKEESLRQKAEQDQLTGLYNKITSEHLIKDVVEHSDENIQHALIIIDVDNFKNINDRLGHLYGDIVLAELSICLKSIFRENDILGRLGGDEFFVFIQNCSNEKLLMQKAKEICKVFNKTYSEGTKQESISASVGIALYPKHGNQFEQLYKNADIALYHAKRNGKNNFTIFNGETNIDYVSDRTNIDNTGKTKNRFKENRVEYIFRLLYESDNVEVNIESALKFITEHFGFSRGYIFETDTTGLYTNNTFEWCVDFVEPEINNLQNVPIELVNTAHTSFINTGIFIIENLKKMPREEREILEAQGIQSMFQFGIMSHGEPIGFIGFDDCVNQRSPSLDEIEELRLICNVFATFLTKQRAAERAENNYSVMLAILNNFEGYAYVVDRDTYKIIFENTNTQAIIGNSSVGKYCYKQYMQNDAPCKECPIAGLTDNEVRNTVEIHNKNLGVFLRTSASKIDWINGKQNYLISSVDVTAHKNQEVSMDKQLNQLLSLTKIGAWNWDVQTGNVIYSDTWSHILGYTKEELLPTVETWENMVFPNDLVYANEEIERHFSGEKPIYEAEFRMVRKDGSVIWAQDKGHVSEFDTDGNPVHFMGVLQDVSRIKNAEMRLKENQATLDLAVNVAELGTWDWNLVEDTIQYNDEYLSMLGLTQNDVTGSLEEWEETNHPDDLPLTIQALDDYIMGKTDKYECEIRMKHKDGHYIWTRDIGRIVERDSAGNPTRLIGGHLNIDALKRSYEQLNQLAYYDELTGLANLTKFRLDAKEVLEQHPEKSFVFVKIDIVNFKMVNDIFGNDIGDMVIKKVAEMIQYVKNLDHVEISTLARVHDDVFIFLDETFGDSKEPLQKRSLTFETLVNEQLASILGNHYVQFRYGRYFAQKGETDVENAIESATIALSKAKSSINRVFDFDISVKQQIRREVEFTNQLQYALAHEEFIVFLQGKYCTEKERLCGAEALVRWRSNDGSLIPPVEFIPVFEKNNAIIKVDLFVFAKCCSILANWKEKGLTLIPISVNFSRRHLANVNFAAELAAIANEYCIDPSYLEIELTETVVMDTQNDLTSFVDSLHAYGFTISIDDFGTGYSSLGLLKNLNIDTIKLDRSFFLEAQENVKAHAILSNMINMAIDLGIKTVAEGVEERVYVDLLCKLNCDSIQGYYFARPIPAQEFTLKLSPYVPISAASVGDTIKRFGLRKNNELLTDMLDSMPLSFVLWNSDIRIVQCNKAIATLFGFPSEEAFLSRMPETLPEYQPNGQPSLQGMLQHIRNAFEKEYVRHSSWVFRHLDGTPITCEVTLVRIVNKGDFMIAAYLRDMRLQVESEELIKYEQSLAQTNADKYKLLLDINPLCINIWDNEKLVMCNQAARSMFGIENEQTYIDCFYDFSPEYQPDGTTSRQKALDNFKIAYEQGEHSFRWMHQNLKGEPIPTEIILTSTWINGKKMLATFIRDMRPQLKVENELRQEQARLHAMMDASPLCFNLWNEQMQNTMCNKVAPALFGLENEQEYLSRFFELSPKYQPDGRLSTEKAYDYIWTAFETGSTVFEWMHQTINGSAIPAEVTLHRIELDGKPFIAGFTRDLRRSLTS